MVRTLVLLVVVALLQATHAASPPVSGAAPKDKVKEKKAKVPKADSSKPKRCVPLHSPAVLH